MYEQFKNIEKLYGNASVRLPNGIFRDLSSKIKNRSESTNIKQVSFAYCYLISVSFLYKYAHFVDIEAGTYIQNGDIKELLGYNKTTKTIDKIIKKDGVLDKLKLTSTTSDFPISFSIDYDNEINDIFIREFETINDINDSHPNYNLIKDIVKNKNYTIKEPLFLTAEYDKSDYGTLYSIERTHQVEMKEFMSLVFDDEIDNVDILMYFYFKAMCKGLPSNMKSMALYKILIELGIDASTFYKHLQTLKEKGYLHIDHKKWKMKQSEYMNMEANTYQFIGVQSENSEIWRDVLEFEDLYEVSNLGSVRRKKSGRPLRSRRTHDGYRLVTLSKGGKGKSIGVHRLVALNFIDNPESKRLVNHKNRIRDDNRSANLEWVTHQENTDHSILNGGRRHKVLTQEEINEVRRLYEVEKLDYKELGQMFGVSPTTTYHVIARKGRFERM